MARTHRKISNVYALTPGKAKGMRNAVIGLTVAAAAVVAIVAAEHGGDAVAKELGEGFVMPGQALMQDRLKPEGGSSHSAKNAAARLREVSEAGLKKLFGEREEGLWDKEHDGKGEDYAEDEADEEAVDAEALKQALADLQPLLEQLGNGQGFAGAPVEGGYGMGMPAGPLGGTMAGAVIGVGNAPRGARLPSTGDNLGSGGFGGGGFAPSKGDMPVDPVPVPGAMVLMLTGLAALGWKKRRA